MSQITKPVILNETGERIADALEQMAATAGQVRVTSLTSTPLRSGAEIVEAIGIPQYIEHPEEYSSLGLTEKGWYVFARIACPAGRHVTGETRVSGAAGSLIVVGSDHIDVAVRYDVAALAVAVVVTWGPDTETFVFKASDLAVRNLDYRTTYYIYDIEPFITWEWGLTADTTFSKEKQYYTKNGDEYTLAEVQTVQYNLTADATFQTGKKYYTREGDVYTEATVTVGEAVTANTYYEASDVPVPADTYYNHTKLRFAGMTRNISYRLNTPIDCPIEIVLPEVPDDGYGCWFEIQVRALGGFSITPEVPEGVQLASNTLAWTAKGIYYLDMHYANVAGLKLWRCVRTSFNI